RRTPLPSFLFILRPPASTLFPYTPLFRSPAAVHREDPRGEPVRRLSSILRRKVVTESGLELGRCYDVRGELGSSSLRVTDLCVGDRKSTRLNSSHEWSSYAAFCLKKKRSR